MTILDKLSERSRQVTLSRQREPASSKLISSLRFSNPRPTAKPTAQIRPNTGYHHLDRPATGLVRTTEHGRVLNTIDPPTLQNSAGEPMNGVVNEVAISPHGSKIAWSYVRYSCPIGVECMARYATGYTAASRYQRVGRPNYFHAASWVANS